MAWHNGKDELADTIVPFVVVAAAAVAAAAVVEPWLWWMKACCWLCMSSRPVTTKHH